MRKCVFTKLFGLLTIIIATLVVAPASVWGQSETSGTCVGNPGCESIRNRDQCIVTCAPDIGSNVGMNLLNPITGSCVPGSSVCRWKGGNSGCKKVCKPNGVGGPSLPNPIQDENDGCPPNSTLVEECPSSTCQSGATCSSDADCGEGGTCGGTELMPNDLQGLEWNSSHPSWNKLCKWDAMVPNTYTPIYYGGQVGPQAKTRALGVIPSCSATDYNDSVWSQNGKKKVYYVDFCRNGASNAGGSIEVPQLGVQFQCGWEETPKVCQCSSATCGPGESLQSVYMSAAFRHFERPTGSYGAKKIMAQYGTPYYTEASNIGEAINKVYSGWNFTYRGNSEFAAFWLENQFSPGVMMPHTIQGSKIHATEYAILNGNMSSVPGRITASHPGNGWDYYTASSLQQDDILGGIGGITVGSLKSANPGLGRSSLYQDGVYVAGPYKMCVSTTPSSEPVCGSAHGVATATAPSGSALCSVGAPFGIVNGPQGNPASYTWLCQHNSKKVQCQAPYQPPVLAETCVPYQPSVHTNTAVSLGSAKALGLSAVGTTIPSHPDVSVSTEDYQVLSGDLGSGSYLKVTFTNLFRPILIGPYVPQFIQHTHPANNKFYGCNPANRNAGNPGAWNTHFKVSCEVCTQSDYPDPICGDYQIETHTNTDITTPIPILQPVPTCWDHTDVFCFDKNGQKHYDVGYEVFYKTPFVNGGFYRSGPEGPQNVADGQTSDMYSCKIISKNHGKRIAEVSIATVYSQGNGILDSNSNYYERESVKKIGNDCGDPTRVTTPITQISTLPIHGGNVLGLASRSKTKVVSTMKGNYPNPFNLGTTVIGSLSPSIGPDHAVASIVGGSCQVGQVMNWNPNTKRRQCVSGTKTVECPNFSYAWETGDWGVCTGGSQTRTVVCKDSTGAVVADNFCSSPKPTTTQSCTNQQGVCGPSHGRPFMTSFVGTNFAHVPGTPVPQITAGLCASGTPSAITKVTPASGVQYWSWTCGSGKGQATCSSHVACNGVKACDDKTYCAGYIPPSAPRCENPSYDKINECRRQCRKNGPNDLVDSIDYTDEGNGGGYHNGNADFTHAACPSDYCIADANQSNCDRLEGTWNYGFAQNGVCTVCPGGNCYGTFNTAVEVGVQYCRNCHTPGDKGGYTTLFNGKYGGCNNAFSWDACYRYKGYRKNTMISSLRKIGETCLIGTPRGNALNNGRLSSFGIGVGLVSPNKVCEPANLPGSNWSIREPGAGRYAQTLSIH